MCTVSFSSFWRTACISKWRNLSFMPPIVSFLGFVVGGEDGPAQGSSSPPQGKLQLCAFFSRCLSPAERNYDNSELLAIKLALEEWCHWLERAEHPFTIWTDHKNLIFLHPVKRLNARQAHWSLFFSRFFFALSYHPGSRNVSQTLSLESPPKIQISSPLSTFCHPPVLSEILPGTLKPLFSNRTSQKTLTRGLGLLIGITCLQLLAQPSSFGPHGKLCLSAGRELNSLFAQMLLLVGHHGKRCEGVCHSLRNLCPEQEQLFTV